MSLKLPLHRCLAGLLVFMICALAECGWALEAVNGPVVLSLSGNVLEKNTPRGADFDLQSLEKLPQHSFTTHTPWDKHPVKFTGPYLRDVLAVAKAHGKVINAVAVNDYKTEIPFTDASDFDVILALKMNERSISVRTKGPLFIVYPYHSKPVLQDKGYRDRSAWQVRLLHIE